MGMERVKGENYHQHNTVLIFKNSELKGYYEELQSFPLMVTKDGVVEFPENNKIEKNIDLKKGDYPEIIFVRDKKINPENHTISKIQWIKNTKTSQ